MKFNKIILLISLALSTSLTSCDFLDVEPQDFVSPDQFYQDQKEAYMGLIGVYNFLADGDIYGTDYGIMIAMASSDLVYYNDARMPVNMWSNNYSASEAVVLNTWKGLYYMINNANVFLEKIDAVNMDETLKANYKGEALFLRAYAHFLLAQHWGDVPYKTASQNSVYNVTIAATPQTVVLESVAADMVIAEALVRDAKDTPAGHISQSAVRGVLARVYLKLAGWPANGGKPMYEKALKWAKAVNGDETTINSGGTHKLNPNYEQIFINIASDVADVQYRESIWEIEFVGNGTDGIRTDSRLGNTIGINNRDNTPETLGYSYGYPMATLPLWIMYNDLNGDGVEDVEIGSEEERIHPDIRRDWNIAPFSFITSNDAGTTVTKKINKPYKGIEQEGVDTKNNKFYTYTPKLTDYIKRNAGKYRREYEVATPRNKNRTPINYPVLRYADVLLMIAEADNEFNGSPSPLAYEAINAVRARSIAAEHYTPIVGKSYDEFKTLIKAERARELCFEGQRKLDLLRWDDYLTSMASMVELFGTDPDRFGKSAHVVLAAKNATERYKWLPIPVRELGLNTLLKQNPAWN